MKQRVRGLTVHEILEIRPVLPLRCPSFAAGATASACRVSSSGTSEWCEGAGR